MSNSEIGRKVLGPRVQSLEGTLNIKKIKLVGSSFKHARKMAAALYAVSRGR